MELNIAYSSDDNYCRHLMVSILSLLDHNKEFEKINLYVLSNNISESNKASLQSIAASNDIPASLKFIEFSSVREKIRTDNTFSLSSFGRLFLDDFIHCDKILYLDCDSVVNGSFYELMQINMDGYICCAVQDNVSPYYKKSIGLKPSDIYFNAGFLLIDLVQWRAQKKQQQAIKMIAEFNGSVPHHDQGVINAICYKQIKRLHPKYNLQCPMFEYTPKQLSIMNPGYYDESELKEALDNPVFIHYTEGFSNRPWRINCTHPLSHKYKEYQDLTPYAGMMDSTPLNRNAQIVYQAYKSLPFPIYRLFLYMIRVSKRLRIRR